MIILGYILVCIVFIFLQALFSASEIAFISTNLLKLKHRTHRGDKKAQVAFELISNPEKFLATTLVGTNFSVIVSSSLATLLLIHLDINNSNLWIMFIFTPLIVIFAELVPKNIARFYKERFSCAVAMLIKFFERVFTPAVIVIEKMSRFLVKLLVGKARRRSLFVTKEEIKSMLKEIEHQGVLDRGEKEAIEEIFDFRQTIINNVLTPVKDIVGLDYTDTQSIVLEKTKRFGFTRYPVFRNKQIIGYINMFDLFYNTADWLTLIRPITRIGEDDKLYDVFTHLRENKENIAVVIKGRKTLGIVTLDDLMKEIVTSIVKY